MTGQFMPQGVRDEAERALNHEGSLVHMLGEAAEEIKPISFDAMWGVLNNRPERMLAELLEAQAAKAVQAPLEQFWDMWPYLKTDGGVSGDAIAGARAARMFGYPDFDLWEQVRARD